MATVRRSTAAAWADHVVLETIKGGECRLPMVPATDVDFLTEMGQAHRGTGVDERCHGWAQASNESRQGQAYEPQ